MDGDISMAAAFDGIHPDLVAQAPSGRRVAEWESAALADSGEGDWV